MTQRDLGERTFAFACDVVRFSRKLAEEPGVVRHVAWQLSRSGTSVAANYEEAKGAFSRREFAAKNAIVLKEAREARLWLRIILACNLAADIDQARRLHDEVDQLVAIFITSVRKLRRPQVFGVLLFAATFVCLP
ncbi:MAG TPA: four helix bundle protein [Vicinamibacterales bacterium]|nr:four helix bundle protein [Vicinamibacterales bacterium]